MSTRPRLRYPSDLSDAQWSRLEALLPEAHAVGRHRTVEQRNIANAINYRWETGCVWRMLPHDFPPWGTVYAYFRHWQRAGVIRQLREILLEPRTKPQPRAVSAAEELPPDWPADNSASARSAVERNLSDSRSALPQGLGFSLPKDQPDRTAQTESRSTQFQD